MEVQGNSWRRPGATSPVARGTVLLLAVGTVAVACGLTLAASSIRHALLVDIQEPWRARPAYLGIVSAAIGIIALQSSLIGALLLQRRQRLRAERSLLESEERMALAALSANMGLWRWERDGERIWATDHFRRVMALDGLHALTRDLVRNAIHPEDRSRFDLIFEGGGGHEQAVDTEFRVLSADGSVRWITGKARLHSDSTGPRRLSGVVIDVTERKRAEAESQMQRQQLAHLTRVAILGELSGALAHELNQPLTSILSNAQAAQHLLARRNADINEVRNALRDIVADDKRAGEVIRRLRALMQRGETELQRVEVAQLVSDLLILAHSNLILSNVEVRTRIQENLPAIRGDRIQFQQVLLNLLLNACEAMADLETGRVAQIDVSLEGDGSFVRVSVSDRGRGIRPEELERVFDPFFTTKTTGLGLGLAICRTIVSAHGGRLWATNNPEGGASFHFTAPVDAGAETGERMRGAEVEETVDVTHEPGIADHPDRR